MPEETAIILANERVEDVIFTVDLHLSHLIFDWPNRSKGESMVGEEGSLGWECVHVFWLGCSELCLEKHLGLLTIFFSKNKKEC
jgi:hypothetical protein